MKGMLGDVVELSTNITLVQGDPAGVRRPAFGIRRRHGHTSVVFASVPDAAQFTSFVLAILQVAGIPIRLDQTVKTQILALEEDLLIETYISFSCHNCADVVQMFNAVAALNPRVKSVVIDGSLFAAEVNTRDVRSVPMMYVNGQHFGQGRTTVEDAVARLAQISQT